MVIDIGSNTVKYDVFSLSANSPEKIAHRSNAVRLIGYVEKGKLSKEGLDILCRTLTDYAQDAVRLDCSNIFAFATAAFRLLAQPSQELESVRERTGISVRLLSGEEEARCSFIGMQMTCENLPDRGMMLDMGGGSTEINIFDGKQSLYLSSCPFGALSVKKALNVGTVLSAHQKKEISEYVKDRVPREILRFEPYGKVAVLVGGTAKACATLAKTFFQNDRNTFGTAFFENFLKLFENSRKEEIDRVKKLLPDRYELMASGLCAFLEIFTIMHTEKIVVCSGGIREGYLSLATEREKSSEI